MERRNEIAEFFNYSGYESVLDGPAETGKTFACCLMMHLDALRYPKLQGVMVRKVRADIPGTVCQTFEKIARSAIDRRIVTKVGGNHPDFYQYINGSQIWIAGLDRPGAVLSSERDRAYICQMEQIKLDDYEHILTRCTGRAGNAPYGKVYGDCNPDHPKHWILERAKTGHLRLFKTTHKDNPRLWDGTDWTQQGRVSMDALDRLTGVRRKRLRDGLWCGVEGLVYDMFDDRSIIDSFKLDDSWTRHMAIDWGFRDPMVIQWWAKKGELSVMYREIYMTGRSIESIARQATRFNEPIQWAVSDHDPQKQHTFRESYGKNLTLYSADKRPNSISIGIHEHVSPALKDGRIKFFRDALVEKDTSLEARHLPIQTTDEFTCYAWPEDSDGRPRKEVPIDANNHGMDCIRYFMMKADLISKTGSTGGFI